MYIDIVSTNACKTLNQNTIVVGKHAVKKWVIKVSISMHILMKEASKNVTNTLRDVLKKA